MSYEQPIPIRRPGKSHRFDVFSPKLGRALTFYSQGQLDLWVLLEAAPGVQRFCERPAYLLSKVGKKRLADFWVRHRRHDEFVLLGDVEPGLRDDQIPGSARVRWVTRKTLAQHATYVANWRSILPYVTTYRRWLKDADLARAVALCAQPAPLAALERALPNFSHVEAPARRYVGVRSCPVHAVVEDVFALGWLVDYLQSIIAALRQCSKSVTIIYAFV